MNYLLVFFISFLLVELITPYVIKQLIRIGVVDHPESRRVHREVTPRMGGVIIYSVVIILLQTFYQDLNSIRLFFMGSVVIFICGILDDLYDINWQIKLVFQCIASALLLTRFANYFNTISFFGIILPTPIDYIVTFLFFLGTINSINLMDGLDGLVSGFSIIALILLGFLGLYKTDYLITILTLALLGSLLAFVKYNSFPAKLFMGDTGSLVLGYFLVFIVVEVLRKFNNSNLDLAFPVLFLGLPILDTLKVMWLRVFDGKSPFLPDKSHLHHIILKNKVRHKTTVFLIHIFSLTFMVNAIVFLKYHNPFSIVAFICLAVLLFFAEKVVSFSNRILLGFKVIVGTVFKLPPLFKLVYIRFLLIVSIICFYTLLLFNFKTIVIDSSKTIFFLLGGGLILLTVATINHLRGNPHSVIYFFLNCIFAFSLNSFFNTIPLDVFNSNYIILHIGQFAFYYLVTVVIMFLMARYSLITEKIVFINGVDLLLIVATIIVLLVPIITQLNMPFLSLAVITCLVLLIWFKIIHYFYLKTSSILFYSIFIFNFIVLLNALVR